MLSKTSLGMMAAAIMGVALLGAPAFAEGDSHSSPKPPRQTWSFAGFFGKYDQAQLQRGFKVFREVCSSCHAADKLAFRNLAEPGGPSFSEAQVKALAAEYKIKDGPNDAGDMFERPGRTSDHWPSPFANDNAARAANGGALPPDMSLLAKARSYKRGFPMFLFDALPGIQYQEHGADYITALMLAYKDEPPHGVKLDAGQYWNDIMPGNRIAMPKPISDGQVDYTDGTPATMENYAKDVSAFLMWLAEPKLDQRKKTGFQVLVFMLVLTGLLFATKKRVWSNVDH
ncbi:MAG: cytochrome c1 [Rhodoblastus sp.]